MEESLWYLLAGTRGSENRARIVAALDEQPRNANRLAEALDLDYNTVRHHLDTLREHGVVGRSSEDYGAVYRLTDEFEAHRDTYEQVLATVSDGQPEATPGAGDTGGEAE